ncbi:MAG: class I SAM-dependent methyltransferase [Microbacteriaceae bacterium]
MLDAAERLALDLAVDAVPSAQAVVVWGEEVRNLAHAAQQRWLTAEVAMWNDFVGDSVPGIIELDAETHSRDARVEVVLVRLPKSLAALDDWAGQLAERFPNAVVVAAGMLKHMTLGMNDVLRQHYGQLDVSHARQKARALIAQHALPAAQSSTASVELDVSAGAAAGLNVVALGGVFAGAALDIGTRVLLDTLNQRLPQSGEGQLAVDLGCGSGLVASWLAHRGYHVRASDRSLTAVQSTRATAEANGVGDQVDVRWEDALAEMTPASAQLIVLNPPFHDRSAVSVDAATTLFAAAGRALVPGGQLVTVWNSHLRYRPQLERLVGPTEQWARTPKFTVTLSTALKRQ